MLAFAAISLTCWLCAAIAAPPRPMLGNEVAQGVYTRLLGRQQRLTLLALLLSGAALLALLADLPSRTDPDLQDLRDARVSCVYPMEGAPICPILQPGGVWAYAEVHRDGTWQMVPTATGPVIQTNPFDDPGTLQR